MISQLQSIRVFVDRKLSDLVLWPLCQGDPSSNADRGSAIIPVKGKRFRITSTSAYIDGPMGKLTMEDLETNHQISGAKSDVVWSQIEAYIRRRAKDEPEPVARVDAPLDEIARLAAAPVYSDTRVPYLGQGVTYVTDWPVGGMTELAAIVTKIISPTVICVTVFPMTGELFWRNDLPRRSEQQKANCWDFSEVATDSAAAINDAARAQFVRGTKKKTAA